MNRNQGSTSGPVTRPLEGEAHAPKTAAGVSAIGCDPPRWDPCRGTPEGRSLKGGKRTLSPPARSLVDPDKCRKPGRVRVPRLDDAACARRTIDLRSIRSAHCKKRHLRTSSRSSAPRPAPNWTILPFPAPPKISFGRRLNGCSTNSRRSTPSRREACRSSAKRRSRICRRGRIARSASTMRLSAS